MNNKGTMGENFILDFLIDLGFDIICQNYHSRYGEIDIIAASLEYIVFVEVKTRNKDSIANPCEFVNMKKQEKIKKTALDFLSQNHFDLQPRFDVAEVFTDKKGNIIEKNYIPNAF